MVKIYKELSKMKFQRAREIALSLDMADVTYNKTPIYIELVNEDKGTASIHALDTPEVSQEVSLSSLQEH